MDSGPEDKVGRDGVDGPGSERSVGCLPICSEIDWSSESVRGIDRTVAVTGTAIGLKHRPDVREGQFGGKRIDSGSRRIRASAGE